MFVQALPLIGILALVGGPQGSMSACPAAGHPDLALQQSWAKTYYPSFAINRAPARIALGFIIDRECRILRHSAGFPDTLATSTELLASLFPDLPRRGIAEGIGDAVPPLDHSDRKVKVVWRMVQSAIEAPMPPPSNKEWDVLLAFRAHDSTRCCRQ